MFFSLKFSPAVKPIQYCSMEVAPSIIDLNVTPGHKSHLSINIYDYKRKTSRFIVLSFIVREVLPVSGWFQIFLQISCCGAHSSGGKLLTVFFNVPYSCIHGYVWQWCHLSLNGAE